jgi:hypothetical protein
MIRDINASSADGRKVLIASAEAKKAEHERAAADAAEKVEAARERLAKIARGESVPGGLGKKLDIVALLKAAGWTPAMFRHARLLANLTEAELKVMLGRSHPKGHDATDKIVEREARRIIRERK